MLPRLPTLLIAAAALGGCSVVPRSAWTYDGTHPLPRVTAEPGAVAPLTDRVAQLQLELNEVRAKIAAQPGTFERLPLYRQENDIHSRLAPLQRELAQYASAR
ncbi:hypothetical protein [Ramlibacter sp. PS4R-6]|uniref:hypothetical protein n=1 Tax=Ramlibacter sp. PS4R-6 TaxID=3133438 RepID=UPI0030A5378C